MIDSQGDVGVLAALGIGALDEMVYRLLLGHAPMSAADLAAATGGAERQISRVARRLEALGLVSRTASRPPRFTPALPSAAIEAVVLRRQEELQQARLLAARLDDLYRGAGAHRGLDELVEILRGREAIAQRFLQLRAAARDEVLAFDTPPYATDSRLSGEQESSELAHGIRMRAIYDRAALGHPGVMEEIRRVALLGEEGRMLPKLPMKLAIVDRSTALVPLRLGEPEEGAIVVHESPLLDALATLFDVLWQRAERFPFAPGDDSGGDAALCPDEVDLQILVLMAAGHKDESIAHALRLTGRTVRRRTHRLLEGLGIETRFQLGRHATLRSWLPPPGEV